MSLARYLREHLHLTGTKISCGMGGCGSCTVEARFKEKEKTVVRSVNACLVPVLSCDEWEITTVEGIGSKRTGLSDVQGRLADFHGTQCGFCSPGMVMAMKSLIDSREGAAAPSTTEVENALDGNICRCTGYRPILDAFKTFASDAPGVSDIEDIKKCPRTSMPCVIGECSTSVVCKQLHTGQNDVWFQPRSVEDLLGNIRQVPEHETYRLVGGNTGAGVYDDGGPFRYYIDVTKIPEMRGLTAVNPFTLGAATTLTSAIELMTSRSLEDPSNYEYLGAVASHLRKVANASVRNVGTIAGNLMLKKGHSAFPSDVFVLLVAAGGKITLRKAVSEAAETVSVEEWLRDRDTAVGRVILTVAFPPMESSKHIFRYEMKSRDEVHFLS